MATAHTRTVKARRLGRYLEELRHQYGLTLKQVTDRIEISQMTLSRVERGLNQTHLGILEKLLDVYRVAYERRMEILELAGEAFRSGWWIEYDDVLHDVFAVVEDEARRILSFQSAVIPGLLQTDAYSRALFECALPSETGGPHDVERMVRARRERRAILERPDPPDLHVVLTEGVLRQVVGGAEVMVGQLQHLLMAAERDNVTLQVLPYSAGAHAGMSGPFVIFEFEHSDDPDIVHTENLSGSAYSESAGAVERFRMAWGSVTGAALPPRQSVEFISALAQER